MISSLEGCNTTEWLQLYSRFPQKTFLGTPPSVTPVCAVTRPPAKPVQDLSQSASGASYQIKARVRADVRVDQRRQRAAVFSL